MKNARELFKQARENSKKEGEELLARVESHMSLAAARGELSANFSLKGLSNSAAVLYAKNILRRHGFQIKHEVDQCEAEDWLIISWEQPQ